MPAVAKADPQPEPETPADTKPDTKPKAMRYLALVNLSISRVFSKESDKAADIIHRGETVELTEEQAHGFLHRHKRPVIRPATDKDPAPRLNARDLFGKPPGPQFGVRPDPPLDPDRTVLGLPLGVSFTDHTVDAPEAHDPQADAGIDPAAVKR